MKRREELLVWKGKRNPVPERIPTHLLLFFLSLSPSVFFKVREMLILFIS
jgi:hypothetical protein